MDDECCGTGHTSQMVHVQVAHTIRLHDGLGQRIICVQKPWVLLQHQFPVVLIRPQPGVQGKEIRCKHWKHSKWAGTGRYRISTAHWAGMDQRTQVDVTTTSRLQQVVLLRYRAHLYSHPGWFLIQLSCQGLNPLGTFLSFQDWCMICGMWCSRICSRCSRTAGLDHMPPSLPGSRISAAHKTRTAKFLPSISSGLTHPRSPGAPQTQILQRCPSDSAWTQFPDSRVLCQTRQRSGCPPSSASKKTCMATFHLIVLKIFKMSSKTPIHPSVPICQYNCLNMYNTTTMVLLPRFGCIAP